jgi:peptidoglycan/LPS O-acetylase OafA/YrhL
MTLVDVQARVGWRWLSVGALIVCAPQWMLWLGHSPADGRVLVVAGWFTLLGLLAAIAGSRRREEPGLEAATATAASLTALFAAAAMVAVWATIGRAAAGGWLAAVALA